MTSQSCGCRCSSSVCVCVCVFQGHALPLALGTVVGIGRVVECWTDSGRSTGRDSHLWNVFTTVCLWEYLLHSVFSPPRSSPSLLRSFRQWGTDGARQGVKAHLVFIHWESERQHEQKENRHEKTERVKKSGNVSWSLSIIVYMSWDLDRLCLDTLPMLTVYKGIVEHGKYLYTYMKSSIAVSSTVCDFL